MDDAAATAACCIASFFLMGGVDDDGGVDARGCGPGRGGREVGDVIDIVDVRLRLRLIVLDTFLRLCRFPLGRG